jgi:hypothetical protein
VTFPFERLRALVRWSGDDPRDLALEVLGLLGSFAADPVGFVTAVRQIVAHHPENPYVWWLAARLLAAADSERAAADAERALRGDRTGAHLVAGLPFPADTPVAVLGETREVDEFLADRIDIELLDVDDDLSAVSHVVIAPIVVTAGAFEIDVDAAAALVSVPVTAKQWLILPTGRALPRQLFDARRRAIGDEPDVTEVTDLAAIDRILIPDLPRLIDAPVVPELLRGV